MAKGDKAQNENCIRFLEPMIKTAILLKILHLQMKLGLIKNPSNILYLTRIFY
ncbi:hypothetical protein [Clostridium frigidicarnis]|uniref:hypothetical protein n=1 Tax=Clostridium frigidicarnis TaxID=84698 RepID=UPI003BFA6C1B